MNALLIFIAALFVIGVAVGAYAFFAPRAGRAAPEMDDAPPRGPEAATGSTWAHEIGPEYAALSESARCDLIFAVGALDDERSRRLLVHALDDASATVALAAAHVLARSGRIGEVRAYVEAHRGARSDELVQLLSIMA